MNWMAYGMIFGVCICLAGVCGLLSVEPSRHEWANAFLAVTGLFFVFILAICFGKNSIIHALADETNFIQISTSGERKFLSQVEITYQDGKLKSVLLVPNSTKRQ